MIFVPKGQAKIAQQFIVGKILSANASRVPQGTNENRMFVLPQPLFFNRPFWDFG